VPKQAECHFPTKLGGVSLKLAGIASRRAEFRAANSRSLTILRAHHCFYLLVVSGFG